MTLKNQLWLPLAMTLALSVPARADMLPTDRTWENSHPELRWGMSLTDFQALKNTDATSTVAPMEARPLDYLLMDFHEVDKDDPFRQPLFWPLTYQGDIMTYVFYRGRLCMTARPILLFVADDVELSLRNKYHLLATTEQDTPHDLTEGDVQLRTTFFYQVYSETPSTYICLVKVYGFDEDDLITYIGSDYLSVTKGDLKAAYVVHLPKSYLTGENAYKDWEFIRTNSKAWSLIKGARDKQKCAIEN